MKIEFRKVPLQPSDFELFHNSVKFSGTFSKISPRLAKVEATLEGECMLECCKCAQDFTQPLSYQVNFLVSDGVYSNGNNEEEFVVVEALEHFLDFDELLQSEIESYKSEYHVCDTCKDNNFIDIEY